VQVGGERVLVDLAWIDTGLGEPPGGLHDLRPSAVVESDPEVETVVLGRLPLEAGHLSLQLFGRPIAAAEKADAHTLAHEIRKLTVDRLGEDLHQRVDLLTRARPVLGRERIDRHRVDAQIDRGLDRLPESTRPRAMPGGNRQAPPLRPACAPVHDDGNRTREVGTLRLW
jgi:hypothetical protein